LKSIERFASETLYFALLAVIGSGWPVVDHRVDHEESEPMVRCEIEIFATAAVGH
jgi:hypothetical protein